MNPSQKLWIFKEEEVPLATTYHEGGEGPLLMGKRRHRNNRYKHNFIEIIYLVNY